jgi:hypothetical protein
MEQEFEEYIHDFGGLDPILSVLDIDPVKVLALLYDYGIFNPQDLIGAFDE